MVPNEGQIADRDYKPRPDVLFQVEGQSVFIKNNGITFILNNLEEVKHEVHEKVEEIEHSEEGLGVHSEPEWERAFFCEEKVKIQQVSCTFLGCDKNATVETGIESKDYLNYYYPNCLLGVTKVSTVNKMQFKEIYKGIDVIYYGTEKGELKYDFHIGPKANPNQIKFHWTGVENISIGLKGELIIETQIQNFSESLPLIYQLDDEDTMKVDGKYDLKRRRDGSFIVKYLLGEYDQSKQLIIDPWVTNYGGADVDYGNGLAIDNDENVLMSGVTSSIASIAEDGYSVIYGGLFDAFLVKFTAEGERLWGTYYGGDATDNGANVAVDENNNYYMSGSTQSEVGISYLGFQNEFGGLYDDGWLTKSGDLFLVKFNEDGERIWATYYGGEGGESGGNVATSKDGHVYLCGSTGSENGIATIDGLMPSWLGPFDGAPQDALLVKFTEDGDRVWGTYYGGNSQDAGIGVALDGDNNPYLCGMTSSTTAAISSAGCHQESSGGEFDGFLVKFNPAGDRLWGTFYGGFYYDFQRGGGVACDTLNNVYLAGMTSSEDNIAFEGYQMEHASFGDDIPLMDACLIKFDPEGTRIWSTYFGGELNDYALSVDVDAETNNVLISGDTYSLIFPVSDCAIQQEMVGTENAFIAQFISDGELYCSSYFGANHEENNVIAFGGCYIYTAGSSPTNVSTPGSHQETHGGGNDAYLAQIYKSSCGIELNELLLTQSMVEVTSCSDCDGEFTVHVSTEGCTGAVPYLNYTWSNGYQELNTLDTMSTISDLCPGEYWVEVQSKCGEKDTLFFEMGNDLNIPSVNFEAVDACIGEPVEFVNLATTPDGTFVLFQWAIDDVLVSSEEDFTHTFDIPGTYEVTLYGLNSFDCADSASHEIIVHPKFEGIENIQICQDSLYTFPDGTQILITSDSYSHISNLSTIHGCDSIIVTTITAQPSSFGEDTIFVDYGSSIILSNGEQIDVFETVLDTFILVSAVGCDSISAITYIVADFSFSPPNIFSPNDDDANNTFYFPNENIQTFECVIVNRWGVEVFHFNSITDKWDGKNVANGKNCSAGVYFYSYSGTFINNVPFQGQGTVQLIRGK